jgi:hypothetical protein
VVKVVAPRGLTTVVVAAGIPRYEEQKGVAPLILSRATITSSLEQAEGDRARSSKTGEESATEACSKSTLARRRIVMSSTVSDRRFSRQTKGC